MSHPGLVGMYPDYYPVWACLQKPWSLINVLIMTRILRWWCARQGLKKTLRFMWSRVKRDADSPLSMPSLNGEGQSFHTHTYIYIYMYVYFHQEQMELKSNSSIIIYMWIDQGAASLCRMSTLLLLLGVGFRLFTSRLVSLRTRTTQRIHSRRVANVAESHSFPSARSTSDVTFHVFRSQTIVAAIFL